MMKFLKDRITELVFVFVFTGVGLPNSSTLKGEKIPNKNTTTKNMTTKPELIFNKENNEKNNVFEDVKENQEIEEKIIKNVQNVTVISMVLDFMYHLFKPNPGPSGASTRKARIAAKNNLGMTPIGTTTDFSLPKNRP